MTKKYFERMINMKKMQKAVLIAAAVVMISASACQKPEDEKEALPTLKWYLPGEVQADSASVMEKANEILEKEAGCRLDIQYMDAGVYSERMTMQMASNDPYDLCFTGYVNPYIKAARAGGLLSLDDYLDKYPSLTESLPDYALQSARVDGKIYAIPNMQVMANATGLFMLEDLVKEYGQLNINEVKTLNDIEPFLEWVKNTHPEKYPIQGSQTGGLNKTYNYRVVGELCRGVFVKEENGELSACNEIELPNRIDEAKLMEDYYNRGYIRPDIALVTDESSETKASKFAAWRGVYKPGADAEMTAQRGTNVICIPISEATIPYNAGKTTMTGVGRNSKYPEKSIKVIELMNTNSELYNLICFGIEGKHYVKTDEKHVEVLKDNGYDPGSAWRFGNQFNAYLLPGQADDVWEQTKKFNNEADVSPLLGFNFDNTSVRTEIAQIETVFNKYPSMYKGFQPLESYYDEFVAELEKAGVNTVIAEANRQLEEFLKTK